MQPSELSPNLSPLKTLMEHIEDELKADDLMTLFPLLGFQPKHDATTNTLLYYCKSNILLFPPCTDKPVAEHQLSGIKRHSELFIKSNGPLSSTNYKYWLFPINTMFSNNLFWPRNTWVLLVYSQALNQFYWLDPKGKTISSAYMQQNKNHIEKELNPLLLLHADTPPIKGLFYGVQDLKKDASAYWVAYFILQLGLKHKDIEIDFEDSLKNCDKEKIKVALYGSLTRNAQESSTNQLEDNFNQVTENIKKADFIDESSRETKQSDDQIVVSSLLRVPTTAVRTSMATQPQRQSSGFRLEVYSVLILSGGVSALLALCCLTMASALIPATLVSGMLVLGLGFFVVGGLGKCGLFGVAQSPIEEAKGADLPSP